MMMLEMKNEIQNILGGNDDPDCDCESYQELQYNYTAALANK